MKLKYRWYFGKGKKFYTDNDTFYVNYNITKLGLCVLIIRNILPISRAVLFGREWHDIY